jgi:hypothetical protein
MPCPAGLDIPTILGYYNEYHMSGGDPKVKERYWEEISPEKHSEHCIACGECEEKCPQELPIRKLMNENNRLFPKPDYI